MEDWSMNEMNELSEDSESEKIFEILSEKLPQVEDTLSNTINIMEEIMGQEKEIFNERIDFIQAFQEILEIIDLTKSILKFNDKKKIIDKKIKRIECKYIDLKSNFRSLKLDKKSKDQAYIQLENILKESLDENHELKINLEEMNQVIKNLRTNCIYVINYIKSE